MHRSVKHVASTLLRLNELRRAGIDLNLRHRRRICTSELRAPSAVVPRAVHASITKPVIKTLIKGGIIGYTAGRDPVVGIGDFVSASVDGVRAEMQASAHEKQP